MKITQDYPLTVGSALNALTFFTLRGYTCECQVCAGETHRLLSLFPPARLVSMCPPLCVCCLWLTSLARSYSVVCVQCEGPWRSLCHVPMVFSIPQEPPYYCRHFGGHRHYQLGHTWRVLLRHCSLQRLWSFHRQSQPQHPQHWTGGVDVKNLPGVFWSLSSHSRPAHYLPALRLPAYFFHGFSIKCSFLSSHSLVLVAALHLSAWHLLLLSFFCRRHYLNHISPLAIVPSTHSSHRQEEFSSPGVQINPNTPLPTQKNASPCTHSPPSITPTFGSLQPPPPPP